jgi:hypothetical protein
MKISHLIELLRRFPQDAHATMSNGDPLDIYIHVKAHDPQNKVDVTAVFCFDDPNDSMPWLVESPQQEN